MTKHCPTCGAGAESTANFCRIDGTQLAVEQPTDVGATVGYETLCLENPEPKTAVSSRLTEPLNAGATVPYPLRHLTEPTAAESPAPQTAPRPERPIYLRAAAGAAALSMLLVIALVGAYVSIRNGNAGAAAEVSDVTADAPEAAVAPDEVLPPTTLPDTVVPSGPAATPVPEVVAQPVKPVVKPVRAVKKVATKPPAARRASRKPRSKSSDTKKKSERSERESDGENYGEEEAR
jgi:hypothetical protein